MLASSAAYGKTITGPHQLAVRLDVLHDGVRVAQFDDMEVLDGSVDASVTSRVSRTLALTVPADDMPDDAEDLLNPDVAVVQVSAGVRYGNGMRELFPVFTGRLTGATLDTTVSLTGDDNAGEVVGLPFEQPVSSITSAFVTQEFERLVLQAMPTAVFGEHDVDDVLVPALTWDTDRGQALDDLATAVQGRWYALGNGDFVLRRYPYTVGVPVVSLADGPSGLIQKATISRSRTGVVNSVIVDVQRADGGDPIRVAVRNTDPTSPTAYGDAYGRVGTVVTVQTVPDTAAAQAIGRQQMAASAGLAETWSAAMTADYRLEPGDTVSLTRTAPRRRTGVQVIDRITYPLTTGSSMQLTTRASTVVPASSDVGDS